MEALVQLGQTDVLEGGRGRTDACVVNQHGQATVLHNGLDLLDQFLVLLEVGNIWRGFYLVLIVVGLRRGQ